MIPFIIAAVGGYLIGDAMKSNSKKMADGGMMVMASLIASYLAGKNLNTNLIVMISSFLQKCLKFRVCHYQI